MALLNISLRDFVIVSALQLDASQGFTVLTGETGAGKSILIDALQLVLGARADASVVREGASRCEIAAEFSHNAHTRDWLLGAGFDPDADGPAHSGGRVLLRRTIDAAGKSRAFVNGSPATVGQLRELGEQLVDIHGQHAWQSLTRPEAVRQWLDGYGQIDGEPMRQAWAAWRVAAQQLDDARHAQSRLQDDSERLAWQLSELDKLAPGANEWGALNAQHAKLSHAQALVQAAQQALNGLEGDDTDSMAGSLQQLRQAQAQLSDMAHIEPQFMGWQDVLSSAQAQMADVVRSLHSYLQRTEPDPQQLADMDARLGQWLALARRHKTAPADLPALWAKLQSDAAQLAASADVAALEAAHQAAEQTCLAAAAQLSAQRQRAAPQLASAVTRAMQELGMAGGRFEIDVQALAKPCAHGQEDVHFLVAGHAGSTPRPAGKVASGGELSRIALAIAVCTSSLGHAQTLIFDEVDSGVGGAVAETVGRLMQQLGRHKQVLAVTHLPQVAACADHHWVVSKQLTASHVNSQVQPVQGEARVLEIARMLGGETVLPSTLAHARDVLGWPHTPRPSAHS